MKKPPIRFAPQPGPQTDFLKCSADIAVFGGSAGGGKSFALLLDAAAGAQKYKNFGAVIFRRTSKNIMQEGGLWDKSEEIYPALGGRGTRHNMKWVFERTSSAIGFAHMEHEKNRYDYQGSEIAYIGFDESTQFTEKQLWYLVGRNRSMCGFRPCVRLTCNPDPDSFVAKLVEWYVDQVTGLAIPERSGIVRFFLRIGDDLRWGATRQELIDKYGDAAKDAKSFTFIRSRLEDNPKLTEINPGYRSTLMSLSKVDRERLLFGNWKIRPVAGTMFRREWFEIVAASPAECQWVRSWDLAASKKTRKTEDLDWTVGLKVGRNAHGTFYVADMRRDRVTPEGQERMVKSTATQDPHMTAILIPQDPAQAGVFQADYYTRALAGLNIHIHTVVGDKVTRALAASAQAEAGNIKLVRGDWNAEFLNELENFPDGGHDDCVDATSDSINYLTQGGTGQFKAFAMGAKTDEVRQEQSLDAFSQRNRRRSLDL